MLSTKGLSGSMDSAMIGGTSCAQGQLPGWLRQGRYAGGSTKIKHVCVYEVCVTYIYIYCLIRLYMIINIIYEKYEYI